MGGSQDFKTVKEVGGRIEESRDVKWRRVGGQIEESRTSNRGVSEDRWVRGWCRIRESVKGKGPQM